MCSLLAQPVHTQRRAPGVHETLFLAGDLREEVETGHHACQGIREGTASSRTGPEETGQVWPCRERMRTKRAMGWVSGEEEGCWGQWVGLRGRGGCWAYSWSQEPGREVKIEPSGGNCQGRRKGNGGDAWAEVEL